ncbi:MAG: hypothetical protein V1658_00740, partial [Candidatus Micrarchaeota archaeon]
MAVRKPKAGVPKIEGFERVKYHGLVTSGLPARAYAAYFGKPKRIIDAYKILYMREKQTSANTGRISNITSQLVNANYLDLYKVESSNWPLLTSNLLPLFEQFELRKIRLNEGDRKTLQAALVPNFDSGLRFGINEEEAFGKEEFKPPILKMQTYLNSAASLALISLFKQGAPEFKEERELLRRIKEKAYGATGKAGEEEAFSIGDMANFASDMVLKTRVGIKEGEAVRNLMLFKIIRFNHDELVVKKMEE